jgi:hypothetical protein
LALEDHYTNCALAQFYNDYARAQAVPHAFPYPDQNIELAAKSLTASQKRKRALSSRVAKRSRNRL